MMKAVQTAVLDMNLILVILGRSDQGVLRNLDPAETAKLVEEGVSTLIQAHGPTCVLVDPHILEGQTSARKARTADQA